MQGEIHATEPEGTMRMQAHMGRHTASQQWAAGASWMTTPSGQGPARWSALLWRAGVL